MTSGTAIMDAIPSARSAVARSPSAGVSLIDVTISGSVNATAVASSSRNDSMSD